MEWKWIGCLVLGFGVLAGSLGAEEFELTDEAVAKLARQKHALQERWEARSIQAKLMDSQLNEKYQWHLVTAGGRTGTREDPLFQFQPVFSPVDAMEVGVRKNSRRGVSYGLGAYSEQMSSTDDTIDRATTAGFKLDLEVDLWKNLLGKVDQQNHASAEAQAKVVEKRNAIDEKVFALSVRKLYWALVANAEAMRVTEKLIASAERQLADIERRKSESVANAADVSRRGAQVTDRKATLKSLDYQRHRLIRQLKELLPGLNGKTVKLTNYDLNQTIRNVLVCTQTIVTKSEIPWEFTQYDELVSLIDQNYKAKVATSDRYAMSDLKLMGSYKHFGQGTGYDEGIENFSDEGKGAYSVMLQWTMPLGKAKNHTRDLMQAAERHQFEAESLEIKERVKARHLQTREMIYLLHEVVKERKASSEKLMQTIEESERMYEQARVSVDVLINDQNALFANLIDSIQTKHQVIDELMDYFQVFTETPCELNKI